MGSHGRSRPQIHGTAGRVGDSDGDCGWSPPARESPAAFGQSAESWVGPRPTFLPTVAPKEATPSSGLWWLPVTKLARRAATSPLLALRH